MRGYYRRDILKLEKHPDKTLIGRTEQGFDFLGYFLKPHSVAVSEKTVDRCIERIARLYEYGTDSDRIGQYVLKWLQWMFAGWGNIDSSIER